MKWVLYNILFAVVYPFLLPGFLVRMLRRGGYAARMGDRFALYPEDVLAKFRDGSGFVWIHAVSVGEVQVAGQLMREWRAVDSTVRFCLSTTSSTGWKMAEREVTARDVLIYNPLDFPNFVKSALKTVRPKAVVLTESEIWPNFILTARRMKVPVFLVNARVSDRSAPRYRAARWFFRDVFAAMTRIFAQSDLDASRLVAAGAPAEKVEVSGSFKFDVARRDEPKERALREWIGPGRILLGGSTWPGEDKVLLDIYSELAGTPGAPVLVIAPRHFEKADAVEANIAAAGFRCVRRSRAQAAEGAKSYMRPLVAEDARPPVFLADTTGELMGLYGIADVVFVGKSLCEHGSQNMIEPCLCGKPTAVGPYTENFRPVMSDLLSANAIVQVKDEKELGDFVKGAFKDDGGLGARAAAAVARRRGVAGKCVTTMRKALSTIALAAAVVGCGRDESPEPADKEPEERTFRVVKTTAACIAAVECPSASQALLADAKAEAFRPFLEPFGLSCVSGEVAAADARFDIVFLAGRADAGALAAALGRVGDDGVLVWRLDVKDMAASAFKSCVESFPCPEAHLWMQSADEWTIVGRRAPRQMEMDDMMEVFSRESAFELLAEAKATAFSDVFASYAGRLSDTGDAFRADDLSANVRPEFFLTKDIPDLDWIVRGDVDEDIYAETMAEIRSMQVVRRLIVEGDMTAAEGKADDAMETWARAFLRNPRDPMLLDRIDRLARNAGSLLRIGNVSAAAKCYETIIVINPGDASAVMNYGMCLRRLGKKEMADQVMKRAQELGKR
jgi:3-deoxy-D-manno-octulosonic-acid transferase